MNTPPKPHIWTPKPKSVQPGDAPPCHMRHISVGAAAIDQTGAMAPQGAMMSVNCVTKNCRLWLADTKECLDIVERKARVESSKALKKISDTLESMDGYQRMPNQTGE